MTITVHLDTLEESTVEEQGGVIVKASRSFLVDSDSDSDWPTGVDAHTGAQTILDNTDLPAPGIIWSTDNPCLILYRRVIKSRNRNQHEGVLLYRYINRLINAETPFAPILPLVCTGSLKQRTTDRAKTGAELTLRHGNQRQTGEINVMEVQWTLRLETLVSAAMPERISVAWVNHVNATEWKFWGGAAKTWLCTNATYQPLSARGNMGARLWIFEFEFKYDPFTWSYEAFWRDPTTGKRPQGLSTGVGQKHVDWYFCRDFNQEPSAGSY